MHSSTSLLLVGAGTSVVAFGSLAARQDYTNSTCSVYGIDFMDGGSYFINSLSTVDFTTVQQFSGCNDDSASILLVQQSTEDEWECTSVPTGKHFDLLFQRRLHADLLCSPIKHITAFDMST
jgi:hypothetical protein